ncbi:MAG TPA: hypothetical protein VMT29_14880 [Steroidobacteraceae bacterium]|nr:hypothetical protein [Steroidobacteraceae bacterium]
MPLVLYPPPRPQSVGEVLDASFRIFRATLPRCVGFGVLAMVAAQLQSLYDIARHEPLHQFGGGDAVWWALYALGAVIGVALINAILVRQVALVCGLPSPAGQALWEGLRQTPGTLGILVVLTVAVLIWFVPLLILPFSWLIGGVLLLSLPASYVGIVLSCAWPALIVGKMGVVASLRYSVQLTRPYWWRTSVIYSVGVAIVFVFVILAALVAAVMAPFGGVDDIAAISALSAVLAAVLAALVLPFMAALALAVYGELEVRMRAAKAEHSATSAPAG